MPTFFAKRAAAYGLEDPCCSWRPSLPSPKREAKGGCRPSHCSGFVFRYTQFPAAFCDLCSPPPVQKSYPQSLWFTVGRKRSARGAVPQTGCDRNGRGPARGWVRRGHLRPPPLLAGGGACRPLGLPRGAPCLPILPHPPTRLPIGLRLRLP